MKSVEPTATNITIPFKSREVGSLIFLLFGFIQNLSRAWYQVQPPRNIKQNQLKEKTISTLFGLEFEPKWHSVCCSFYFYWGPFQKVLSQHTLASIMILNWSIVKTFFSSSYLLHICFSSKAIQLIWTAIFSDMFEIHSKANPKRGYGVVRGILTWLNSYPNCVWQNNVIYNWLHTTVQCTIFFTIKPNCTISCTCNMELCVCLSAHQKWPWRNDFTMKLPFTLWKSQ